MKLEEILDSVEKKIWDVKFVAKSLLAVSVISAGLALYSTSGIPEFFRKLEEESQKIEMLCSSTRNKHSLQESEDNKPILYEGKPLENPGILKIKNKDGLSLFDKFTLKKFIDKGYSIDDLMLFEGKDFSTSDLFFIQAGKVPPAYAASLDIFSGYDISQLWNSSISKDYAVELSKRNFDTYDIQSFSLKKIPLDYITGLLSAQKLEAYQIKNLWDSKVTSEYFCKASKYSDSYFEILSLWKDKVPIEYVAESVGNGYSVHDASLFFSKGLTQEFIEDIGSMKKGENALFDADALMRYFKSNGTKKYADEVLSIEDKNGIPLFDGSSIANLKEAEDFLRKGELNEVPVEHLKESMKSFDWDNKINFMQSLADMSFSVEDILIYTVFGGSLDFAKKVTEVYPVEAVSSLFFTGLSAEMLTNYQDTDKPNALITLPLNDPAFSIIGDTTKVTYREIFQSYDAKIRITRNESDLYASLDSSSDIELLITCGHGSPDTLSLSSGQADDDESINLDKSDTEIADHFKSLAPNAVIYLKSCSTAEGEDSLAEFISRISGRKVIASKKPYAAVNEHVNSIYPFDLNIIIDGEDATYKK